MEIKLIIGKLYGITNLIYQNKLNIIEKKLYT